MNSTLFLNMHYEDELIVRASIPFLSRVVDEKNSILEADVLYIGNLRLIDCLVW